MGCGKCPQLDSSEDNDDSHAIFNAKLRAWHNQNFVVVAPSNWLAQRAAMSPLMKNKTILVIPNGIDLEKFSPMDKRLARQQLGLEPDKQYVTFGTLRIDDYNKGFDLLCSALHHINRHDHPIEIILFGDIPSNTQQKFEIPIHNMGLLSSVEQLRHVYAAADTLILPSRQENLSNTLMEAMAIGIPCVAFDIGGNSDLIVHQENGYLASPFSTEDMAQGILWVLNNTKTLSQNAREHIEKRFDLKNIAKQYLDLYHFVYFDK
jgi:glycosyltransferase involved in cell wall biosynthesis